MAETAFQPTTNIKSGGRMKFIVGGVLMLAAVVFLIATNLTSQQEYFMTVNEMMAQQSELAGRNVRISGVVLGDTIEYDGKTLSFTIAHVPDSITEIDEEGGLAEVLHQAAIRTDTERVQVVLYDEPKPDMLQNEAQAIVTGTLGDDGIFYADELLLKCPSHYEEAVPDQVVEE